MIAETITEIRVPGSVVPRLELPRWREAYGVVAGITMAGDGSEWDFGLAGQKPVGVVMDQWRRLREDIDTRFSGMVTGRQIHGSVIRRHSGPQNGWLIHDGVDGHITREPRVLLTVTAADCVPVFLLSPGRGEIGLIHAGWRGIADGILEETVREALAAGANATELQLHLGPAICGTCYQVGPEVFAALGRPMPKTPSEIDLRAVLAARAMALGVRKITTSDWCVRHDDGFHSHRKSGPEAGRLVAYIGQLSHPEHGRTGREGTESG